MARGRRRGARPGRAARGTAAARTVPRRRAARERARVRVPPDRRRALGRGDRRHQPDPPGRGAGRRHPPHRLPARSSPTDPAGPCSTGSTSASTPSACSSPTRPNTTPQSAATRARPRRSDSQTRGTCSLLLFTSGSTGAPKAVRMTQGRAARRADADAVLGRRRALLRDAALPRQRAQREPLPRAAPAARRSRCGASSRRRSSSPTCSATA